MVESGCVGHGSRGGSPRSLFIREERLRPGTAHSPSCPPGADPGWLRVSKARPCHGPPAKNCSGCSQPRHSLGGLEARSTKRAQEELGRDGPYLERLCLLPETRAVLLPPSLGRRLSRGAGALTRREAASCLPTPSGGVSAPGALTAAGALALRQAAGSITAVGGRPAGESPRALRQSELSARQGGRRRREPGGWKREGAAGAAVCANTTQEPRLPH